MEDIKTLNEEETDFLIPITMSCKKKLRTMNSQFEDKSTSTKEDATPYKERRLTEREAYEDAKDFGLGLGVDGTVPSPWTNKKGNFQVRHVISEGCITAREESKVHNSYYKTIRSTFSTDTKMKASIPTGKIVNVGLDCELHSDHIKNKMIIGKRVFDRRISFTDKVDAEYGCMSFEEKVCWFIVKQMHEESTEDPVKTVEEFLPSQKEQIEEHCREFIASNRVTHYVHSLLFGACTYLVTTQEEVKKQGGIDANADLKLASAGIGGKYAKTKSTTETRFREVPEGAFFNSEGRIVRNPNIKGVIEVQLRSVSSLIRNKDLKTMVEKALKAYVDENSSAGGYCISCAHPDRRTRLFFKATESQYPEVRTDENEATESQAYPTLEATTDENEASVFHIVENKKQKLLGKRDPNEFCITYSRESTGHSLDDAPLYLKAPLERSGHNSRHFKFKDNDSSSLVILGCLWKPRWTSTFEPVHTAEWTKGTEQFYINCKHKKYGKDSFICVKKREAPQEGYEFCCTPSIKSHNGHDTFMLFRFTNPYKLKKM